MSGTSVHILTTEGPVAIQRISEEDPSVDSVICLDGLAQILPVSPAYDAFVRRPVGVIERMTGHGAYRMDVASSIDTGRSWQLAAYIAHAARLQAGGSDITVYATGEIDSDLCVRPVDRVDVKLDSLMRYLSRNPHDGKQAVVLVPDSGTPLPQRIGDVPLVRVATANDALIATGIAIPKVPDPVTSDPPKSQARRRSSPVAIIFGAAFIAAALFWVGGDMARWSALSEQGRMLELEKDLSDAEASTLGGWRAGVFQKWRDLQRPENPPSLEGLLFTAEDALACDDKNARTRVPFNPVFKGSGAVCAIEVRGISTAETDVIIGRLAYWPEGLGSATRPARVMRGSKGTPGRTWTLEFHRQPGPGAALRLAVITGDVDIAGSQPWYQELLSQPLDSAVYAAAKTRLERLGFRVTALDWRRE